jgi:peptide/nickel transport system ATP-binding protein
MYLGRIMEVGASEKVFSGPNHPYTEALLSAVPNVDGEAGARILLEGEIPVRPTRPPAASSTRAATESSAACAR